MARGLTSAVKTELATGNINPVLLIEIEFSTPVYLTNASFDITSSVSGTSRTYASNGHLRGITGVSETNKPTKNSLALTLSGVDQTYIALALSENIINKEVYVYRGFLDANQAIIADPFLLYDGQIDTFSIQETETDSTVNIGIVSHWADFDKVQGRKTNNTSQQRFFSTDVGMDFSSQTVQDIKWGRA